MAMVAFSHHVLIIDPRWNCFRLRSQERSGIIIGVQVGGVLFDQSLPNQATLNAVSSYLVVNAYVSGVGCHSTH